MRRPGPELQVVTEPTRPHPHDPRPPLDELALLGATLYAEALHLCDDENEAAACASAALVKWLEEGREAARAQRPRGTC